MLNTLHVSKMFGSVCVNGETKRHATIHPTEELAAGIDLHKRPAPSSQERLGGVVN